MKKISFLFIALVLVSLMVTSCSKKSSQKMIGKWKSDSVSGMHKDMAGEIFYEFPKDSMSAYGSVHGEPLDKMVLPYIIKSEESGLVVIEATHNLSGQKGEFKLKIDGKKLTLTDPNNQESSFSKAD